MGPVVVIGGGLVGLACAHYFERAGHEVILLERDHIAAGASFGNCGLITPSHAAPLTRPGMVWRGLESMMTPASPFRIAPRFDFGLLNWLLRFAQHCEKPHWQHALGARLRLLNSSRELLHNLIRDDFLACDYAAEGTLTAFLSQGLLEREIAVHEAMQPFGVHFEVLSKSQINARFPGLRERVIGGIFTRGDGHVQPHRLCEAWKEKLIGRGLELREGVRALDFTIERERVTAVQTSAGSIPCRRVVLAAGVWSAKLATSLGINAPLQPGKGYSITMPRPDTAPATPILLKDVGVCYTPWSDRVRLGSTMEFTGFDLSLNRVRLRALERGWRRFNEIDLPVEQGQRWAGLRPMIADELPVIGRAPKAKNAWLAFGHGMLGLSMSAATGKLISELALGEMPHIDPYPYRPDRF